jgi:hypothetical protein
MGDLQTTLQTAGQLGATQGLYLVGTTLLRVQADGTLAELTAAAQTTVSGYTLPTAIDYGADLQTETELRAQAASVVGNLRAYLALGSPTLVQSAALLKLMARVQLYQIHERFPDL